MEKILTTKQVADMFQVCERTITQKWIKEGLKYIPIGPKNYRFELEDVNEFIRIKKQIAQENNETNIIKRKPKHNTISIDFQKRKYNIEQNKVI